MNRLSKSVVWAGAAPLALAAIISGGVAFAYQSGDSDTTSTDILTQQEPTPAPATDDEKAPGTTAPESTTEDEKDCANKGSRGPSSGSGAEEGETEDDAASTAGMTFRSRR